MTTTAMQRNAMRETYIECLPLLRSIARRFVSTRGGDFEEVMSECNDHFLEVYLNRWDPTKSDCFFSFLKRAVNHGLLDRARGIMYRRKVLNPVDLDVDTREGKTEFSMVEFTDGLGEDAKTVVELIINTPKELRIMMKCNRGERVGVKVILKRYLSKIGWTMEQIVESFQEITEALTS